VGVLALLLLLARTAPPSSPPATTCFGFTTTILSPPFLPAGSIREGGAVRTSSSGNDRPEAVTPVRLQGRLWLSPTEHAEQRRRQQQEQQQRGDVDTDSFPPETAQQRAGSGRSSLLTPYQILLPHSFPSSSSTSSAPDGRDLEVPFRDALPLIRQALQKIVDGEENDFAVQRILRSVSRNNDTDSVTGVEMIRIEHVLSHPVDPLAWLDAQQRQSRRLGNGPATAATKATTEGSGFVPPKSSPTAAFYMATQEGDEQVACLGSSLTASSADEIFGTYGNKHGYWNRLPANSRFYGGARFDSATAATGAASGNRMNSTTASVNHNNNNNSINISEEWKDFGQAFWMLPTVELSNRKTSSARTTTTLAVHLVRSSEEDSSKSRTSWRSAAQSVLAVLDRVTHAQSPAVPPTTLPPVLSRDSNYPKHDGQELYEQGVAKALELIEGTTNGNKTNGRSSLEKVVLARRQKLQLGVDGDKWSALELIKRWKYSDSSEGGHLFYLRPNSDAPEFFGCTPERLFNVGAKSNNRDSDANKWTVRSEALAGTRPRGSTQQADEELLKDLFSSPKDRSENLLTGRYIERIFQELEEKGWIQRDNDNLSSDVGKENGTGTDISLKNQGSWSTGGFFVRRLLHLQHICQRYSGTVASSDDIALLNVTRYLMDRLHPTPAVCGLPADRARMFIREYESLGFDRGFYSGPVGYIGREASDILVAIRSGLATRETPTQQHVNIDESKSRNGAGSATVLTYAGAGIVSGSTIQGEWAETNYKLAVVSSLLPRSPIALEGSPTPNVAWATAFVEELVRNGVTQFYVCPGSRSTPLVVAISKAVRSLVGVIHAVSVHDERSAGFRALGYGRGTGRPAAVVTSSGTAVANLYPAIVEAGMDGVPMLILTADRPYENRHTGANQAIDQVKVFSSSYVRWFRDMLPPDDELPVSVVLSDAAHAVRVSQTAKGPIHLNMQFRENLAPDVGRIRNDDRAEAITRFNGFRFTDVPGYRRWSMTGDKWTRSYWTSSANSGSNSVSEIVGLIASSKRGIIVIGNLRGATDEDHNNHELEVVETISSFATLIGFPIFAGVQSASLRFRSPAVVPFAEHLLKCPEVVENLQPDLIIQIGSPLISTAIPSLARDASKRHDVPAHHVLIHPHFDSERVDPDFTVTHTVSAEISPFLNTLSEALTGHHDITSELAPLILLGRRLQAEMKGIIEDAAIARRSFAGRDPCLTEPELIVALAESFAESSDDQSLFLSNSMPIRDCEFFLYPYDGKTGRSRGPERVGTNRGASGIDGIISSAAAFAESSQTRTSLFIGDLATLHDIGSMHSLAKEMEGSSLATRTPHPLTITIVNNNGGGIFSFLPIAQHGDSVGFKDFFGTPTRSFSFEKGARAFGLPVKVASDASTFRAEYRAAVASERHTVVEACVANHETNVAVHQEITKASNSFIRDLLRPQRTVDVLKQRLPIRIYSSNRTLVSISRTNVKTLVLLHGWMGDKDEWDKVASSLVFQLPSNWKVVSVDLPGHGNAPFRQSSDVHAIKASLRLEEEEAEEDFLGIDAIAKSVMISLQEHHGIDQIDALAGYSLGGRVALAMKRLCESPDENGTFPRTVRSKTKLALLSVNPGSFSSSFDAFSSQEYDRMRNDDRLASQIVLTSNKSILKGSSVSSASEAWGSFLDRWYSAPIWGQIKQREDYHELISKRSQTLGLRGRDLSRVLSDCSPPRNHKQDWEFCLPSSTLFVAGNLDTKYTAVGKTWSNREGVCYEEVLGVGHALLFESPSRVAEILSHFLASSASVADAENLIKMGKDSELPQPLSDQLNHKPSVAENSSLGERDDIESGRLVGALDFEEFSIDLVDDDRRVLAVFGIGWGSGAAANGSSKASKRSGFIIQLAANRGVEVGVGEVSPLPGLHQESIEEARKQLNTLQSMLRGGVPPRDFDASASLRLDGALQKYLEDLARFAGIDCWLPSVRSGLEMALLSLASQAVSLPIHQALSQHSIPMHSSSMQSNLAINGLITRAVSEKDRAISHAKGGLPKFPSTKVKVGHQSLADDALSMSKAFQRSGLYDGIPGGNIRADANRAWNEVQAIEFASALDGIDLHSIDRLEFIEEPLEKQIQSGNDGSTEGSNGLTTPFEQQIGALERWHMHTGIKYALDETLADLVFDSDFDYNTIRDSLSVAFGTDTRQRGCAAFVLKPALLGLELSFRIARYARAELGIGAVFSSSFDSGVGLAYTSFLGYLSDGVREQVPSSSSSQLPRLATKYPHGVGTFPLLSADTLSPPFASYVSEQGVLNVASLSRAFFGLSLDDMRPVLDSMASSTAPVTDRNFAKKESESLIDEDTSVVVGETHEDSYEASTATSSGGNEISVVVSLPLPFSASVAHSRFTDLPQHSRWSPWISSVAYQGNKETEWTLNVKGIPLRWRATSQLLDDPYLGIEWESVSGLSNRGKVEFIPDANVGDEGATTASASSSRKGTDSTGSGAATETCHMNVRMSIRTPRLLRPLFEGNSLFLEDFLRNKLLRWSLEMFRDVVKADLALERGDVELGDALFSAVEGKATAIEATFMNLKK